MFRTEMPIGDDGLPVFMEVLEILQFLENFLLRNAKCDFLCFGSQKFKKLFRKSVIFVRKMENVEISKRIVV